MFKIAIIIICSLIFSCNTDKKDSSARKSKNNYDRERPRIKDSIANDYYSQGLNAVKQDKLTDAENYFYKADKIENNNPIIVTARANIAYALGDSSRGESLYLHAISIDSVYVLSYLNYAKHLRQEHQPERANSILLKAIHFNPNDYDKGRIYHDLALLSIDLNSCDSAMEYAKKARIFSPDQYLSFVQEIESLLSPCNVFHQKLPLYKL